MVLRFVTLALGLKQRLFVLAARPWGWRWRTMGQVKLDDCVPDHATHPGLMPTRFCPFLQYLSSPVTEKEVVSGSSPGGAMVFGISAQQGGESRTRSAYSVCLESWSLISWWHGALAPWQTALLRQRRDCLHSLQDGERTWRMHTLLRPWGAMAPSYLQSWTVCHRNC